MINKFLKKSLSILRGFSLWAYVHTTVRSTCSQVISAYTGTFRGIVRATCVIGNK
nr:MAG TPA: hypothetical protein [Caudoviricetes sp.]